ncbi:MAG: molybdenum cofactor guanylyltransferase [Methanocellales archaeon]|nr:molybdenum cofactor guanylyltransferase [Methanocellales archaeon]MDD3420807.1 molybdenum cofactor guanylyltransferase [Methanocellales archaeon]MDD4897926.1 molybdenum cofactor guanylyltransferase [Methanocellales archaeon]MDD5446344.1 molybdenum cofactor guanylyltransferase [Methanocellales archaeon]
MRSAIILAGGKSTRINTNKSMAQIGNKKMIEHVLDNVSGIVDEVLVVAGNIGQREKISTVICGARITYDSVLGYGPVAGILAGLQCAKGEYALVVACDMPFINPAVVDFLFSLAEGYDAVVPIWPDGNIEPLHAIYKRKSTIKACEGAIQKDDRRIISPLKALSRIRYVSIEEIKEIDPELRTFINVNTMADLERIS